MINLYIKLKFKIVLRIEIRFKKNTKRWQSHLVEWEPMKPIKGLSFLINRDTPMMLQSSIELNDSGLNKWNNLNK